MSTVYVSNTTSNSYTTGSDANSAVQAQSKATPWLTITFALANATAGDTIVINGGTYLETAFLNAAKLNYTMNSDGAVTVRTATAGDTKVISFRSSASGFILGTGFIFDGQGVQTGCIASDGTGGTFILHGFQCINYTTQATNLSAGTWTLDGGWSVTNTSTVSGAGGITFGSAITTIPSVFNISNGTIILGTVTLATIIGIKMSQSANCSMVLNIHDNVITGTANTGNSFLYGMNNGSATRADCNIYNNTITLNTLNSAGTIRDIYIQCAGKHRIHDNTVNNTGQPAATTTINAVRVSPPTTVSPLDTLIVENNSCTVLGVTTSTTTKLLLVDNVATAGVMASVQITKNNLTLPAGSGVNGGYGILVGVDTGTPSTKNTINNILINSNIINGGQVGIFCANVNAFTVINNKISNCVIALKDRLTNQATTSVPGTWLQNRISALDGTGAAMQSLGANRTVWDSNFVTLDSVGQSSKFLDCNADATTPTPSTNCIFRNNILLGSGKAIIAASCASNTDATSNCTFTNNNYYSSGSFAASAWNYQGVGYSTLAAWVAAKEANAFSIDPLTRTYTPRTNFDVYIVSKLVLDTPNGGRVDWSTTNKIAFSHFNNGVNLGEIWMMNPDGTSKVNLTGALGGITHISNDQPGWHPNGIHLVFQSVDQTLYDLLAGTADDKAPLVQGGAGLCNNLWLLNTQTLELTQLNQLTTQAEAVLHPNFSPDGTKLWWAERISNRNAGGALIGGAKWFLSLANFDINTKLLSNRKLYQPFGTSLFYETHGWDSSGQHVLFSTSANPLEADAPTDGSNYALNIGKFTIASLSGAEITSDNNTWNEHAHFTKSGNTFFWISSSGNVFTPTSDWQNTLKTDLWFATNAGTGPHLQLTYYNTPGHDDYVAGSRTIVSDNCSSPAGNQCVYMVVHFASGVGTYQVVVATFNKVL